MTIMTENTWKLNDGGIRKRICSVASEECRKKPHEGTSCYVQLVDVCIDQSARSTAESAYLLTATNPETKTSSTTIQIGISSVTPIDRLIDICITTMKEKEISNFEIEATEDNGKVKFTATLLNFDDHVELYALSDEEKLNTALQLKNDGIDLYRRDKIRDAFHKFSKALKYFILMEDNAVKAANMNTKIALQCNLAGCQISQKNYTYAVELCDAVLEKEPDNIKALYRRGCALLELNEFSRSRSDLTRAHNLEPNNQAIKGKINLLHKRSKASSSKLAHAMQKMFE